MTDNDVISIVTRTIKNKYPAINVEKERVAQDAAPPLFYVYIIDSYIFRLVGRKSRQNFKMTVKYYSKAETNADCFEKAAVLWEAFRIMEYNGKKIMGRNMEYKAIEGVLHFYFDVRNIMLDVENNSKFGDLEVNVDARE